MNKYYNLLGLQLEEVEKYLKEKNITYTVKSIQGKKDTDKLIIPKVIKISELDNGVELLLLTQYQEICNAESLLVTFYDHTTAQGTLKKYDKNTISKINRYMNFVG